jgi:hypothetical protein
MTKAGESFVCACCKEPHALLEQPAYDADYRGPVCEPCRRLSLWSKALLKRWAKASRSVESADVTISNYKRFEML